MSKTIIIEDIVDVDANNIKIEELKTTNKDLELFKLKEEKNRLFNLVEKLKEEKLQLIFENANLIRKLNDNNNI